jgi:DNA-binding beta-propeller fold protein YncE
MKRTASVTLILFIVLLLLPRGQICAPIPGEAPRQATGAEDSLSFHPEPDTSLALRITETTVRLGSSDLREPTGVAVDFLGCVYVADAMAGKVFRYAPDGSSLEFERPPNNAAFYPIDVAVLESFVLVLDYSGNTLLRYDAKGAYLDVLIAFDQFDRVRPVSVTAGPGGSLITADVTNHTVALWTPLLDLELMIGEFGWGAGRFNEPRKGAFLSGRGIVVVESGNRRLQFFSPSGRYERTVQPPASLPFVSPRSVSVDPAGVIFVCDPDGGRISVFNFDGSYVTAVDAYGGNAIAPAAAAVGWDGKLYVADLKSRSVLVYRLNSPRDK